MLFRSVDAGKDGLAFWTEVLCGGGSKSAFTARAPATASTGGGASCSLAAASFLRRFTGAKRVFESPSPSRLVAQPQPSHLAHAAPPSSQKVPLSPPTTSARHLTQLEARDGVVGVGFGALSAAADENGARGASNRGRAARYAIVAGSSIRSKENSS